ncbi:kinase-like domain-containing protein [Gigaspora rosea]|uniref:Kinase-like domain-containing protein n=1 Tax=Gigaspora rosea TaxID=44941 RepID=A0A397UTN8_9GLOM|nr:kinase-like domain-containing protein [Gigaspora rosea]
MCDGYENCNICGKPKTDNKWCKTCNSGRFKEQFGNWTSENEAIDNFIKETQLNAMSSDQVLEWVSFEKEIFGVEYLAKGGYGSVYNAKWRSGHIKYYDDKAKKWRRSGETEIILKSIKDSKDVNEEFFEEIKQQMTSFVKLGFIIKCYGVTKCPHNDNYMMIMDYKKDGSLRKYLDKNFGLLKWQQKLELLYTISEGLYAMHEKNLIHKDFHSGNIIISEGQSYITDFGLCKNVNSETQGGVHGVLPYVAPEVLLGDPYTMAADIYSFGIIMNEIALGYPPYHDIPHDTKLAIKIIHGNRRPGPDKSKTPKTIIDLINRCWDKNPEVRPKAIDLRNELSSYKEKNDSTIWTEIDEIEKNFIPVFLTYEISDQAFYTSRLLP